LASGYWSELDAPLLSLALFPPSSSCPRLQITRDASTRLQRSVPPYLHMPTSAVRLQTFHVCTTAARLNTSTSARLRHVSRAPGLPFLHTYTPAAHLPISIPLCLYVCMPPELPSSIPPRLHTCSTTSELPSSRPHACRVPQDLQTSLRPYLHVPYLQHASIVPELYATMPPRRYTYSVPPGLHASMRGSKF